MDKHSRLTLILLEYIRQHSLLPRGCRALVGVSGGMDSTAMLYILCELKAELGIELTAAHYNHQLRNEADSDELFVRELCGSLGVPFVSGRGDVRAYAAAMGLSIEVAARELRHAFFRQAMEERGCGRLVLAHHRDDQAETVLMRLIRGSGTRGLGAMAALDGGYIVRPMLAVGREEIHEWCQENGIQWREDESNADLSITRNWVRHALLPEISERLNPRAAEALARAAEMLREDEEYLHAEAEKALAGIRQRLGGGVTVAAESLSALHPAVRSRAIRLLIARAGMARDVEQINIEDASALLHKGQSGRRVDLGGGFVALREGGDFSVAPALPEEAGAAAVSLGVPGMTSTVFGVFACEELEKAPDDLRSHEPLTQYFDLDLFPSNAVIRPRLPGDRFRPLGAPGGRKLKEFLIDSKVPRFSRGLVPLVAVGNEALWVVGLAVSDTVKITDNTRRVLKITFEPTVEEE